MTDTRTKIVAAARDLVLDGSASAPSVRAVAARAGVGASTLRHHFPTQPELMEAVLVAVYADAMPDERIRDASVPAGQRLVECLTNLLTPVGSADQARERWREVGSPAGAIPALLPPGRQSAFDYRMDAIPAVGEHTETILRSLGRGADDIAALRAEGAI